MKYWIVLSLFILLGCLQNHPNEIVENKHTSYEGAETQTEIICGLDKIENSKNKIEIRLIREPTLTAVYEVFVLSLNKKGWNALRYNTGPGFINHDSAHPIKTFKPKLSFNAGKLFDILKENIIFLCQIKKIFTFLLAFQLMMEQHIR